jgi:hypothetical protein
LEHIVTDPITTKPALHDIVQLAPEGKLEGQLPMPPFAGGDTEHEPPAACVVMGRLRKAAANHTMSLAFVTPPDAERKRARSSDLVGTIAEE